MLAEVEWLFDLLYHVTVQAKWRRLGHALSDLSDVSFYVTYH